MHALMDISTPLSYSTSSPRACRLLLNKVPSLSLEALSFAQQLESLVAEELFGVMHNPANALQLVQQAVQEAKLRVGVDDMPHYDTRMRSYQITAPQLLSDVLDPSSVSRPLPWHTLNNQYIDVSKFKDARELMRFALTAPNLTWPVCIELSPIMKLLMPMERLPADLKPHEQVRVKCVTICPTALQSWAYMLLPSSCQVVSAHL